MVFFNESFMFLIIFSTVIIAGIYIVNKFEIAGIKKFQLLLSYLGGLSVLLVTYNIYITIRSSNRVEKNRFSYNTLENIQRNYLGPQKELVDHYPEGYFLYASMNQDTDMSKSEPKKYDLGKREQIEVYGSLRVFQAMEDFLSTAAYDITGIYVWINNFLMWMQSPILRHYWDLLAFNYADDTRELVARVIQKSDELIALRKTKGTSHQPRLRHYR